jgi:hypothetical protein
MASRTIRTLHLYTTPLSGCSARIRIAAYLKAIPLTHSTIDFSTSQQSSASYVAVNPNASVRRKVEKRKGGIASERRLRWRMFSWFPLFKGG